MKTLLLISVTLVLTACGHVSDHTDTQTTHWVDATTQYVCTNSGMILTIDANNNCTCSYTTSTYQEACMVSHPKD